MVHVNKLHVSCKTLQNMVKSKQDIEGNVNAFIYHYSTTLYMYVQLYAQIQKHYSEFFWTVLVNTEFILGCS